MRIDIHSYNTFIHTTPFRHTRAHTHNINEMHWESGGAVAVMRRRRRWRRRRQGGKRFTPGWQNLLSDSGSILLPTTDALWPSWPKVTAIAATGGYIHTSLFVVASCFSADSCAARIPSDLAACYLLFAGPVRDGFFSRPRVVVFPLQRPRRYTKYVITSILSSYKYIFFNIIFYTDDINITL